MKEILRRLTPLVLSATLVLGLAAPAGAAFRDFGDVKGHWAAATLEKAYDAGILKGLEPTVMAPDQTITKAQAVTVLCRVLHVTGEGDVSGLKLPADAWYRQDAAKGVYAGLLDANDAGTLDGPIGRADAFRLFVDAFQIEKAAPDDAVLDRFPDALTLTADQRTAAATLVADGVVDGIDGRLAGDQPLTRAQFVTILYRLADRYQAAAEYSGGSAVLSGDAALTGVTAERLWFDQSTANVSLTDVSAAQVALCTDRLDGFSVAGTGDIGRLIVANHSGDVALDLPETCTVETLTVGQGSGSVSFTGPVGAAEVTGDRRSVTVGSSVSALTVSGCNDTIAIPAGVTVGTLTVSGTGNTVVLDGHADRVVLTAPYNAVSGSGRVDRLVPQTNKYECTVRKGSVEAWKTAGLDGVRVTVSAPEVLPAGAVLRATAECAGSEGDVGKRCTATWYINDELLEEVPFVLGRTTPVSAITPTYRHDLRLDATVRCVVTYVNNDGDTATCEGSAPLTLETFSDLGLADATIAVTAPETLAAGAPLTATATVDTPEAGQVCAGTWYLDGKQVASAPYVLGSGAVTCTPTIDYYYGMPETAKLSYVLTYTTEDGRDQKVSGSAAVRLEPYADNGIAHATAALSAPASVDVGTDFTVTAKLTYPEAGKTCQAVWSVDGAQVATQTVTLGQDTPTLKHKLPDTKKDSAKIALSLTYTTADGRAQEVKAETTVAVKNYGVSREEALRTVTDRYIGNYTLAWAQQHDYSAEMKTAWINYQGYQSSTDYLIWVNLTYQRVNIFSGSQGNWKLIRTCLCGAGKDSTPTIKGVFTTSYKQSYWDYGSYYCGPIVRFNGSSGYAFHSRLEYWPMDSDRYYDARIGFPVSHGCLRMYNDDIWWIYDNIPNGTTVVVH